MQSFQQQTFAQMNNFQDNGLPTTLFPHYNGYSLSMPHNNVQMQPYQGIQHQTYQTLTSVNTNHHNDDDNCDNNNTDSEDEE